MLTAGSRCQPCHRHAESGQQCGGQQTRGSAVKDAGCGIGQPERLGADSYDRDQDAEEDHEKLRMSQKTASPAHQRDYEGDRHGGRPLAARRHSDARRRGSVRKQQDCPEVAHAGDDVEGEMDDRDRPRAASNVEGRVTGLVKGRGGAQQCEGQ